MSTLLSIAQPVLLTLAGVGLPLAVRELNRRLKLSKVMPAIRRAFTVIDPLLNEHIKSYGSSEVRFAIELITTLLADGELSSEEVRFAAGEIQRRYQPALAAGKSAISLTPGSIEKKVYDAVEEVMANKVFQGADPMAAARSIFSVIR